MKPRFPAGECAHTGAEANTIEFNAVLDHCCEGDARCRLAKQEAIVAACEGGQVQWVRADGKGYADLVRGSPGTRRRAVEAAGRGVGGTTFSRCPSRGELGMSQRLWKFKLSEVDVWVRAGGADTPGEEKGGAR